MDLTVHQIEKPQGTLKELYKASGGLHPPDPSCTFLGWGPLPVVCRLVDVTVAPPSGSREHGRGGWVDKGCWDWGAGLRERQKRWAAGGWSGGTGVLGWRWIRWDKGAELGMEAEQVH